MELPKRYDPKESEKKWQDEWRKKNTYRFDSEKKPVFSIDTPPPTLSGRMHMGHAFSYTQGDFIARYRRMKGDSVFYPFGTDDNGLPTERLIEKQKKIKATRMERSEFRKIVMESVDEQIDEFVADWINLGISADFDNSYSTISNHCIRTSQKSFLDLYKKGYLYRKETPISWDTKYQTAIAQAEFENIEKEGYLNHIIFQDTHGNELIISTTRPELIPACVALAAHPEDERYKHLQGKDIVVPISVHEVPMIFDEDVDKEFGTGLMMVCTFGDKKDIEKWHKHNLELRSIIERDGTLGELAGKYKGLKIGEARDRILDDLKKEGHLKGQDKITHNVNVYERSGVEVEYLDTPQWFVRILDNKHELLEAGEKIEWYPEFMKHRYHHWVQNLNWDWCISRQRPFGVPFPVWYDKKSSEIILAEESDLPIDPTESVPKKWEGKKELLVPETDVMDTWATSSVTPQITLGWAENEDEFNEKYPMSLRLQAHDIIRTWAFYTITKGVYHHKDIPWKDIAVSGHALDPKGKKMSKSKGNAVDPNKMTEKYGADALRFWAAGSKLGEDLPFQEKDLVTGQKTITKLWNASKFAIMNLEDYDGKKPKNMELMDRWILDRFNTIVDECTNHFEQYEYSKTKFEADNFFWNVFCDYYLEIVKDRLYNPDKRGDSSRKSAQHALYTVLLGTLKLFAPIMPHITEEIYHLYFKEKEGEESIHLSAWPESDEGSTDKEARDIGDAAIEAIAQVRKYKSDNSMSLGAELEKITIESPIDLNPCLEDLKGTCRAKEVELTKGKDVKVVF